MNKLACIGGSIIPVSTSDNLRIGTFGVALVEHVHCGFNVGRRGIRGKEVRSETGSVGTPDTLAAQLASQLELEIIADLRTNDSALNGQRGCLEH